MSVADSATPLPSRTDRDGNGRAGSKSEVGCPNRDPDVREQEESFCVKTISILR